jgi:CheY-like chemotaxis protein
MKKAVILVAEDDMDDRFLLQTAFDENGNQEQLEFVENGVEVINYLHTIEQETDDRPYPGLILLDLNMPKKNGKEVLVELKQHPVFKKIPVIVYTTTKNEVEVRRCYELGANTYIVKPISFDSLLHVVQSISSYWLSTASIPVLN